MSRVTFKQFFQAVDSVENQQNQAGDEVSEGVMAFIQRALVPKDDKIEKIKSSAQQGNEDDNKKLGELVKTIRTINPAKRSKAQQDAIETYIRLQKDKDSHFSNLKKSVEKGPDYKDDKWGPETSRR